MLERRTALNELDWPAAAEAEAALTLRELAIAGAWLINDWDEQGRAVVAEAAGVLGCPAEAPGSGEAFTSTGSLLAAVGPGRFLVVSHDPVEAAQLADRLATPETIECRCQRAWLRLDGRGSQTFLDQRLGIDLEQGKFPVGSVALTRLGQIDTLLHVQAQGVFDLMPARSFAAALAEALGQVATAEGRVLAVYPVEG